MRPLGIDMLTVFSLPPVAFVELAADLGCTSISTGLETGYINPEGYAATSLRDDPALRRELIAAMRDRGVRIGLGEGCTIRPGRDVGSYAADLDLFGALGVDLVNAVSLDPDLPRSLDQFAALAELAAARGMRSSVELCPGLTIDGLAAALAVVRHVGRADFGLLIDTMHLCRSGSSAADLAALDPALIFYVQLCDASLAPRMANYFDEATDRLLPGAGDLPLGDLLRAVPPDVIVSLETPQKALAESGVGPRERAAAAVAAARKVLAA